MVHRVIEVREHVDPGGGLTRIGLESAGHIWDLHVGQATHRAAAQSLQQLLRKRKVVYFVGPSIADYELRSALENRLYQFGDIRSVVLVVTIGVDNDVGAFAQAIIHSRGERMSQSPVGRETQDVFDTVLPGHLSRAVGAAIIDDQHLDLVNSLDLPRDIPERGGQGVLFIETRESGR